MFGRKEIGMGVGDPEKRNKHPEKDGRCYADNKDILCPTETQLAKQFKKSLPHKSSPGKQSICRGNVADIIADFSSKGLACFQKRSVSPQNQYQLKNLFDIMAAKIVPKGLDTPQNYYVNDFNWLLRYAKYGIRLGVKLTHNRVRSLTLRLFKIIHIVCLQYAKKQMVLTCLMLQNMNIPFGFEILNRKNQQ